MGATRIFFTFNQWSCNSGLIVVLVKSSLFLDRKCPSIFPVASSSLKADAIHFLCSGAFAQSNNCSHNCHPNQMNNPTQSRWNFSSQKVSAWFISGQKSTPKQASKLYPRQHNETYPKTEKAENPCPARIFGKRKSLIVCDTLVSKLSDLFGAGDRTWTCMPHDIWA